MLGCIGTPDGDFDESSDKDEEAVTMRRVLLCQQGLSDRSTGWDKELFALCESIEGRGFVLVHDGEFPAFGAMDENGAYKALFSTLDTNHDGLVDGKDQATMVHLIGFSWGGINVTDIANRLRNDGRIVTGRRGVAGMVLLDPYQPQLWHSTIPSNVLNAWEYRQTDTTEGDCSSTVSLGFGFNGLSPRAKSEMTFCNSYDLDLFADNVGHCDVPAVAKQAAIHNIVELEDYAPWDSYAEECPVK